MPTKIDDRKCSGCDECIAVCPVSPCVYLSIVVKNKKRVVVKNPSKCIECGSCVNVCPQNAITMDR